YIPGAPGYYFMPIYADMLVRIGANKSEILSEEHFRLNEIILHHAARYEHGQINWLAQVSEILAQAETHVKQQTFFSQLQAYLLQPVPLQLAGSNLGTPFPSLNRADCFLVSLSAIKGSNFNLQLAVAGWYALMTYLLVLDDLSDIREDIRNSEENVLIDVHKNNGRKQTIEFMLQQSKEVMQVINPVMANRIDHRMSQINLDEIFKSIHQDKDH
ncbi:MAG: hypothetical protein RL675_1003, partial [Bacteroidota bacterium]